MRPAEAGHRLVDVYPRGRRSCFSAGRRTGWRPSPCRRVTSPTTSTSWSTSSPCCAGWSGRRIKDPHTVEDLVQETLARADVVLLAASIRTSCTTTRRSRRGTSWRRTPSGTTGRGPLPPPRRGRGRGAAHRRRAAAGGSRRSSAPPWPGCPPPTGTCWSPTRSTARTPARLAAERGSTPGAVAARLSRRPGPPAGGVPARRRAAWNHRPTAAGRCCWRCPADRRPPAASSTSTATSWPATAARTSARPALRAPRAARDDGVVRVPVSRDADVVTARQKGREVAARAGFSAPT